jgi:hypothetical protein
MLFAYTGINNDDYQVFFALASSASLAFVDGNRNIFPIVFSAMIMIFSAVVVVCRRRRRRETFSAALII